MDQLDWKIVSLLERDGRMSFADLAQQVGLSKSPSVMKLCVFYAVRKILNVITATHTA